MRISTSAPFLTGFLIALPMVAGLVLTADARVLAARPTCNGQVATIVGAAKADVLTGTRGADVIVGRGGDDVIKGGGGDDVICGGAGDDRLMGQAGSDTLSGGLGDDILAAGTSPRLSAPNRLITDPGDDVLKAHPNSSTVLVLSAPRGMRVDLRAGTIRGQGHDLVSGVSNVKGTRFGDLFIGTQGSDYFIGNGGSDVVATLGGKDGVEGTGPGSRIASGAGNDYVDVRGTGTVVRLGDGRDMLFAGRGVTGFGGPGNDDFRTDRAVAFDGGAGSDGVELLDDDGGVEIDLAAGEFRFGWVTKLTSIENAEGTDWDDVIRGDDGPNRLDGVTGEDQLFGAGGDDELYGSGGTTDGGDGDDLCSGGTPVNCERSFAARP